VLRYCSQINFIITEGFELLLNSMLTNLIDNALRYSPQQSVIKVSCKQESEQIVVSVEDSGNGIPDSLKARSQDRFYRIPGSKPMGSGLGLSIVQRIAEIHHIEMLLLDADSGGLKVKLNFAKY